MAKQTIYNAGIYVRLSQEDMRAGESLSIENQKLILTKYVKEQGWNLVDTYVDDGWSGTDFDRPAVQRLLSDAQSGKINLIICKDLSRFGRNYIEVGRYVDYIFPSYNIRFIALNDNVDTASKDTSALDMMPIVNLFNEWHAASTSKKIKAVIEANAKAGKYRTTCAPFGYTKGDDPNHLPVIDPDAAPIVRNIFEMRASGISPHHIADKLNEDGVPIPSDYYYAKLGKPNPRRTRHLWSPETVRQILHNYTYLGHLVQLRTRTVSYKNHKVIKNGEEDMIVVKNTHEAIVSQELWDRVREMEQSVSQGKRNSSGYVANLSGLIYCQDCGNKVRLAWNNTTNGSKKKPRKYIVSRYDASTGELIPIERRIGILDRKLRVVNENAADEEEWLEWAFRAFQSVYGYEYQGDNLLIARTNLLYTLADYIEAMWHRQAARKELEKFLNVICWNFWQMDGLKDTPPYGIPGDEIVQLSMFGDSKSVDEVVYCKIYDWRADTSRLFKNLKKRDKGMKFCTHFIGYSENHSTRYARKVEIRPPAGLHLQQRHRLE